MFSQIHVIAIIFLGALLSQAARADGLSGQTIDLGPHRTLWVEHRPAAPGKQTLFLLNGLNDGTGSWVKYTRALLEIDPGLGIVRYNPRGLPLTEQVADLRDLKEALNIRDGAVAVGLSYGGALAIEYLARYPDELDMAIAFSPYLAVLPGSEKLVQQLKGSWRPFVPHWLMSDDSLESLIFQGVLVGCCFASEPLSLHGLTELLEIGRRGDGIRRWSLLERAQDLPSGKLHLSFSREDSIVTRAQFEPVLEQLPPNIVSSITVWNKSLHRLVEQWPRLSAVYTYQILSQNPAMRGARRFSVEPSTQLAVSGEFSVPLTKEGLCASALREDSGLSR